MDITILLGRNDNVKRIYIEKPSPAGLRSLLTSIHRISPSHTSMIAERFASSTFSSFQPCATTRRPLRSTKRVHEIWERNPMNRADEFRERADQCRRLAESAAKIPDKERWLSLAEHWLLMAQHEDERGQRS
jgi:hypothetical protein